MRKFKALGVQLAEDDLGAGYSSLTRLRQFPFDWIKLDRGIVRLADGDKTEALRFIFLLTRLGHGLASRSWWRVWSPPIYWRQSGCSASTPRKAMVSPARCRPAMLCRGCASKLNDAIPAIRVHRWAGRLACSCSRSSYT
jgi:hypothetical protein